MRQYYDGQPKPEPITTSDSTGVYRVGSESVGSVFSLEPDRMTQKWLKARTIEELRQLLVRWPERCCRGRQIQNEIELREEKKENER